MSGPGQPPRRPSPGGRGGRPPSGPPRPRRPGKVDPARRVAYDLLHEVGARDAYANLALPVLLKDRDLHGRDAAFATELAYGTLRMRGLYDAVLARCVDRALDRLDPPVLDILRMGAHQLLTLRTPPHAGVDATVELARDVSGDGAARLVNAVLRKVTAHDRDVWMSRVAPSFADDPAGHLSVVTSHPRWIVTALRETLGGDWEGTRELLVANNIPAAVSLIARPGRASVTELLDFPDTSAGRWSPYAVTLAHGAPQDLGPVREGRAGVQDEGSQLVALALTRATVDGGEQAWLDLCAGPGGKAALLAGLAAERGVRLLAVERQPHRADLVRRTLRGMPGEYEVRTGDGTEPSWPLASFDRVLVDAPCTGLGALRRRPEARWRRQPGDVAALAPLQRALLDAAIDSTRPGGVVAYVTCSPHLAETDVVVDDVLRGRSDIQEEDARPLLPEIPDLTGPRVRLWPHLHGTDGMFLTLLRRRG